MPKIVYRSNFIPTYSHAYNEFGNFLSIENAVLLHQQQECKWYFDFNKEIELILSAVNSDKVTSHWKAKANQYITTIDGVNRKYDPTLHGESFEHAKFKNEIVENKFFETNKYKVLLQECKTEIKFVNSRFIADVKAKLLCGTDCIIEVIKTSDLSEKKIKEIQKNQILTFKIYIDEFGNQKHSRFKIIGNTELEQITVRIQKGRGAVAEIGERIELIEEQLRNKRKRNNAENSARIFRFKNWLQRRIEPIKFEFINRRSNIKYAGERIDKQRKHIEALEYDINEFASENEILEREKREIEEKNNVNWKEIFDKLESVNIEILELNQGEKITDYKKFIDKHKTIIFSKNHIDIKKNYIERILLIKQKLEL